MQDSTGAGGNAKQSRQAHLQETARKSLQHRINNFLTNFWHTAVEFQMPFLKEVALSTRYIQ